MPLALFVGLNLWVGARLPLLLEDTGVADALVLDQRVRAAPRRNDVRLLVLGNSNALAGLRPPLLATALGLDEHGAFSLALPMASVEELRLLARRYRPDFPRATTAVVAVDEHLFVANAELRARYLSRHSSLARWRLAMRYPTLEQRLTIFLARYLPVLDFKGALWTHASRHPALAARQMVSDAALPDSRLARLAAMEYAWGYPPNWDYLTPTELAAFEARYQHASEVIRRTTNLLGTGEGVPRGLEQLEALCRELEESGLRVVLARVPYQARAHGVQRRMLRSAYARYQAQLQAFLARTGRRLLLAPEDWGPELFHDANHLNRAGARRYAALVAAELTASGWPEARSATADLPPGAGPGPRP